MITKISSQINGQQAYSPRNHPSNHAVSSRASEDQFS